jgi:DNA-binding transcriptional LysR family regulator
VLTEQGEAFFRVVKEMEAQLAQAISRIAESRRAAGRAAENHDHRHLRLRLADRRA